MTRSGTCTADTVGPVGPFAGPETPGGAGPVGPETPGGADPGSNGAADPGSAADSGSAETVGALEREDFTAVFRRHPAGVAVVSLFDGDHPIGFTATSVISVSAQPPIVAFSINDSSSSWSALSRASQVTVNLLAAGQRDVSTTFATSGIDRFAEVDWEQLPTGEPVLTGTAGWVSGRIVQTVPAGSSHLVLVAADRAETSAQEPLVFRNRAYHQLVEYEI